MNGFDAAVYLVLIFAIVTGFNTGLIRSAAVNMKLDVEGKKMAIDFTFRMKSANKAVAGL